MLSQTLPVYDQNQSKPHHKRLRGDVINATTKPTYHKAEITTSSSSWKLATPKVVISPHYVDLKSGFHLGEEKGYRAFL